MSVLEMPEEKVTVVFRVDFDMSVVCDQQTAAAWLAYSGGWRA